MKEIIRCHQELHRAAALDEYDLVVIIEVHQLAEKSLRLIQHVLKFLRTMTDLCDAHARSFEIGEVIFHRLQHFQRHGGGTGVKVVDSFHGKLLKKHKKRRRPMGRASLFSRYHPI